MSVLSRIHDPIRREVCNHRNTVARIAAREDEVKAWSGAQLRAATDRFKERLGGQKSPGHWDGGGAR